MGTSVRGDDNDKKGVTAQDSSPHVLDQSALYGGSQEFFCCGPGSLRLPGPQQKNASRRRRGIRHLSSYKKVSTTIP